MMSQNSSYEELLNGKGISGQPNEEALKRIGLLIDAAGDRDDKVGTDRAISWCDELEKRDLTEIQKMTLAYFRANAWGTLYHLRVAGKDVSWNWEVPELAEELFNLRKSLANKAFLELPPQRQCQMLTNTANCLDTIGRFVEAIEIYSRALAIEPRFWEALGHRGATLFSYGRSHYDCNYSYALFVAAHDDLKQAIEIGDKNAGRNPRALRFFKDNFDTLAKRADIETIRTSLNLKNHSLGESDEEKGYRRWCLENCLFLNSINDMGQYEVAAYDILSQPTFTTNFDEPPSLIGLFNQLKQEFVSARYFYYQSTYDVGPHFSDRGVVLIDTLDYPAYGLNIERMKIAFRMAYSLFDKIAYFLYRYLKLPMKPTQVSFVSVWRDSKNKKAPLRNVFESLQNLPLRGLYWLSKDIVDEEYRQMTEPDASELYEIRNHLEHKYLKTHLDSIGVDRTQEGAIGRTDDLAYSILDQDFSVKTLRILKLARASLIYLSLGMHQEERRREEEEKKTQKNEEYKLHRLPMTLRPIPDEWKR